MYFLEGVLKHSVNIIGFKIKNDVINDLAIENLLIKKSNSSNNSIKKKLPTIR
jgi:hypothetical protein